MLAVKHKLVRLLVCLVAGLIAAPCFAQSDVSMSVRPTSGTVDDVFELDVLVRGGAGVMQEPVLERSTDFRIERRGTTSRHTITNGASESVIVFSFVAYPRADLEPKKYQLPGAKMTLRGKAVSVKGPVLEIIEGGGSRADAGEAEGVRFVQVVDNMEPFAGEQILYRTEFMSPGGFSQAEIAPIDFKGFWRETFGKERESVRPIAGSSVRVYSSREALFATQAGELTIPPRALNMEVKVPAQRTAPQTLGGFFDDLWTDFMDDYDLVPRRITSGAITLKVKPLPPPPQPNLDVIPVGQVKLDSRIDRTSVKEGESVTLRVQLYGDANLRPYELRFPGSEDFKLYPDQPQVETFVQGNKILFKKTFSVALVPQKSGTLELPQVRVVTFDPSAGEYRTLEPPRRVLIVAPDPQARQLKLSSQAPLAQEKPEIAPLGEDLLAQHVGPETIAAPQTVDRAFFIFTLLGIPLAVLAVWMARLRYETALTNPEALRRKNAMRKAAEALRNFSGSPEELAHVLRVYLGERFGTSGRSLTAEDVKKLLDKKVKPETATNAAGLLRELERLTYGGSASVSADLSARVESAVRAIESESGGRGARTGALFLLLGASLITPFTAEADNEHLTAVAGQAHAAYLQGNFNQAEGWYQEAIAKGADNGHMHYNLANTEYRLGNIGKAIVHYRRALAQMPGDPDTIANLKLARQQVKGELPPTQEIWPSIFVLNGIMNQTALSYAFLVCWAVFWAAVFLNILYRTPALRILELALIPAVVYLAISAFCVTSGRTGEPTLRLPSDERRPAVIVAKEAEVHSGDATSFQVIYRLTEGMELEVTETRAAWLQILLPNNRRGWIEKSKLEVI